MAGVDSAARTMECLYCHKKLSSFRFWKNSQFCSPEHASDYRTQTLDRLMGDAVAGNGEKPPLPLSVIPGPEPEPALAKPLRLNAAAPRDEWGPAGIETVETAPSAFDFERSPPLITPLPEDAYPTVAEILARSGKQDTATSEEIAAWQRTPSAPSYETDVQQQTAEDALEALRSLARGSKSDDPQPAGGLDDDVPLPDWENAAFTATAGQATQDADPDDVFAELRRIAASADDAHGEDESDAFDPAAPIPNVSALDRLTETPQPRPRETIPGLTLPTKDEQAAPANTEAAAAISEPDIIPAVAEQVAGAGSPEEPESVSVGEIRRRDAADKVVSFPSQSDPRRKDSVAQANGLAEGGPSFFAPDIHSELLAIDLDRVFREPGAFASSAEVALDETLKAPAAEMSTAAEPAGVVIARAHRGFGPKGAEVPDLSPAIRPLISNGQEPLGNRDASEPRFHNVTAARQEFRRPGGFRLCAAWRDYISATILNQPPAAGTAPPIMPEPMPAAGSLSLALPLGLLEKMGVTPAGRTQRLVRSEFFHKEPEVREFPFPRNDADTSRPTDVRRVYYA